MTMTGIENSVRMQKGAFGGGSKIIDFLSSFDNKISEEVGVKLNDISSQTHVLIDVLKSNEINISNEGAIIDDLINANSALTAQDKNSLEKAAAFGISFGSTVKVNKPFFSENDVVRNRISRLIYEYIDVAKLTSDPNIRNMAIEMATAFLQSTEHIGIVETPIPVSVSKEAVGSQGQH